MMNFAIVTVLAFATFQIASTYVLTLGDINGVQECLPAIGTEYSPAAQKAEMHCKFINLGVMDEQATINIPRLAKILGKDVNDPRFQLVRECVKKACDDDVSQKFDERAECLFKNFPNELH